MHNKVVCTNPDDMSCFHSERCHCRGRYFFYKNMTYTLTQFWFNLYALNSGQRLYDDWYQAFYNLLFTSLPVIVAGLLDQDASKARLGFELPALQVGSPCRMALWTTRGLGTVACHDCMLLEPLKNCSSPACFKQACAQMTATTLTGCLTRKQEGAFSTPQLYVPGQLNLPFSWRVLGLWLAGAVWNSAVCFYVPVWALAPAAVSSSGLMIDIWATGTLGYTLIIVTVRTLHSRPARHACMSMSTAAKSQRLF